MNSENLKRAAKRTAYVVAAALILSGLALAWDNDDYRRGGPDQARQYGYDNGFRDGRDRGRHEGREHDPNDYQTPDWRQATRGYKGWMGPAEFYQRGYQDGYREGFRSGFESVARPRDDRDAYGAYGGREGYDNVREVAYRFGYQDGADMARGDIEHGKPYNPIPRGKFDDRDHGYRHELGNKDAYKAEYSDAYRRGYDAAMNGRY